jgi:hypothetical protein
MRTLSNDYLIIFVLNGYTIFGILFIFVLNVSSNSLQRFQILYLSTHYIILMEICLLVHYLFAMGNCLGKLFVKLLVIFMSLLVCW